MVDSRTFVFGEEQQRWRLPLSYSQIVADLATTEAITIWLRTDAYVGRDDRCRTRTACDTCYSLPSLGSREDARPFALRAGDLPKHWNV